MQNFLPGVGSTLLPEDPEALRLMRQRQMAEMLMAQGAQPIETSNRQAGRFVTPVSPLEGLAKLLQTGIGAYQQRKVDERIQDLGTGRRTALARLLRGEPAVGSVPAEEFEVDAEVNRTPPPFQGGNNTPVFARDPARQNILDIGAPPVNVVGSPQPQAAPQPDDPITAYKRQLADQLESGAMTPAQVTQMMLGLQQLQIQRELDKSKPMVLPKDSRLMINNEVVAEGVQSREKPQIVEVGGPPDARGNPTTVKKILGDDGVLRDLPGAAPISRGPLATATASVTNKDTFKNEADLRKEFRSEPIYKAHQEVRSAYDQVSSALKQNTAIGDVAAATKIMKLLDPGSVVRESELGIAMSSAGLLDRITNYGQMIINGRRLTPQQRNEFRALADQFYQQSEQMFTAKQNEFGSIAKDYGLNEGRVTGGRSSKPQSGSGFTIKR